MTKTSKKQAALVSEMTDYQLANLAATLVYIMLGQRALYALKASLALHNQDGA